MVMRRLHVRKGETTKEAQRREDAEAPFGRCGDELGPDAPFAGCGEPLTGDGWHVCGTYPDCCRP